MNKTFEAHPNVYLVMKYHNYKINKTILQNEPVLRNALNEPMKLWNMSELIVVNIIKKFVFRDHSDGVKK